MIAFVEMKEEWEKDFIKTKYSDLERALFFDEPAQDRAKELREVTVLSVFINSKIDRELLSRFPYLKFIATRSTGFDHIDIQAAREKGVIVSNVPVYGENTVAEHAFALILSLARNLKKSYLRTLQNDFSIKGLMGFDLKGKTIGVVGTGHIGLQMIRIANGFGMNVIAFDVHEQKEIKDLNFKYVSFEELLRQSDIISLHLPLLPTTRHIINTKALQQIKKGAILINTARGELVDTNALVRALDEGILAGAGLDVLEGEEYLMEEKRLLHETESQGHWKKLQTMLKNHSLLHRDNVVYTPHTAFYSREAVQRILDTTIENIESFLQQRITNKV